VGKVLGHYRIFEQIGAGGMGVVFRARDERLERDVAIKVLAPGTLSDEAARQRFRREALSLSKLNHPNIQTVFDFDSGDGIDFLVTELITGVSMDEQLRSHPLPESEVLLYGHQLADAVAAAHKAGVLHRDLKPSNLRITPDRRLKVLDFGLARAITALEGNAEVTQSLALAGTLPYMAPEQLASGSVDQRTDIWSIGCVLYEMATGRRPYERATPAGTAAAILSEPLPSGHGKNSRLSAELEKVIATCLEKDREDRYQSAAEVAAALKSLLAGASAGAPARRDRRWQSRVAVLAAIMAFVLSSAWFANVGGVREAVLRLPAPAEPIRSLAVLPLENLSRDPEEEYFADGMTEALITDLAKVGSLKVISRTSVMQYKGARKPLREIARALQVEGIVEGSVLRSGERVRVNAQLIHAASDTHLWAEKYERDLRDVLSLQSELSRDIVREIRIALTPQERARLSANRAVNPEAHRAYLLARHYDNKNNVEDYKRAYEYVRKAIALDPNDADAWTLLAHIYALHGWWLDPPGGWDEAEQAARRALALDPGSAEAHAALASVFRNRDWNVAEAERHLQHALQLSPNDSGLLSLYAFHLLIVGRHNEALATYSRVIELDPSSPYGYLGRARVSFLSRRYEEALRDGKSALELEPALEQGHEIVGAADTQLGRNNEAITEFRSAGRRSAHLLAFVQARSGRRKEALQILRELETRPEFMAEAAVIRVGLGDLNGAVTLLERLATQRERPPVLLVLDSSPFWDALRSDGRFQELLRRMNFPT
jgi:eukaryotic-like serine/threonine-protein kinase